MRVHDFLKAVLSILLSVALLQASDSVAAQLARDARKAQNAGQLVRAYMLYARAALRDPNTLSYRASRDALAPLAKLLTESHIQDESKTADQLEQESKAVPLDPPSLAEIKYADTLQPLPELKPDPTPHDFSARADWRNLFETVAAAYGVKVVFNPQITDFPVIRFNVQNADFRTAMEALTASTNTFIFPLSAKTIYVCKDTPANRTEFEPAVAITVPLPDAIEVKDISEATNAVRSALQLQHIFLNGVGRTVMIRDSASRARIARGLLESLLLPRAQVSIDVKVIAVDESRVTRYGVGLPTSYSIANFAHLGAFQTIMTDLPQGIAQFIKLGSGSSLFGLGITNTTVVATYTENVGQVIYNATLNVDSGQVAQMHVGDKVPIAQSLFTGAAQATGSIYNPIGQVRLEDLGLILKFTPRVMGEGEVSMDVEAAYKSLTGVTFNTVPEISLREFQGSVRLRGDEWAILAGLDNASKSITRNGLVGLSQIPGLNQVLSDNTRDARSSKTLILVKPTVTRLPSSAILSTQFYAGAAAGLRVLL